MPFSRLGHSNPVRPRLGAAAVILLTACGGGSSLLLPGDGVANHIKIAAGNNQSGRVGEPLTDPLVAQVTDSRDRPVQGVSVAFAFTSGAPGAEINPSTAVTDAKGEANAQVVLGTTIGAQTGEASIVTDGGSAPSTSFTLMAVPKDADGIAAESGDDQSGAAGSKLRRPLVVQVTDAFGNPIPGVTIDWSAGGGGSVSDASNTTDENGLASVERTLGPAAGKQTTQASSQGLAGSPVTFTHTATAGSASSLSIVSGNNQTAKVGTKLPADLVVQLLDGEGNGVPNTAVTWVVGTGGGSVTPQNGTTDAQGIASAQWTLGPNPGENRLDAVVSGVGIANFRATGTSGVPTTVVTTTTITGDSPDPSVSGSPFTVEVRVTSPGPVPTGTVRVTADGAQVNCTVTLQNGAGSCSLALNREGDRTLRATYSGAPGFKASSATAAHRVNPPQQQNRPPRADYNWTCAGLTCQFTDHSSDPDGDQTLASWSWNFGDGGTSPDRNPTHTFPGPGNYLVALTVNDNAGGSNTATAHVNVQTAPPPNQPPTAAFTSNCVNLDCSFNSSGSSDDGNIVGWSWTFGDGSTSNQQNPSHSYAPGGPYSVTLTVTDNGGLTGSVTHQVSVSAPPPAATTTTITDDRPDPSDQNAEFTVSFAVASGSGVPSGDVTVSDGVDSCSGTLNGSGSGSCPITLHTGGPRTLTATYPGNSSFAGSQGTASHEVTPTPPPPPPNQAPTAAFTVDACPSLTCGFTDQSTDPDGNSTIVGWSWDFGDPTSPDNTSNEQNPVHLFTAAGLHSVTLTVTDNGGLTGNITNDVNVP